MKDFKHKDGTRCDEGFHCPQCGGHYFGTDTHIEGAWVVHCNGEYGYCGWSGSHKVYVRNE